MNEPALFPRMMVTIRMLAACGLLLSFAACRTVDKPIETSLTPAEFFQRAQEAASARNYTRAMLYYETFQKTYPDDLERNLWASYEIAFLHHKMGDDRKALEFFDALLERYRSEGQDPWPQAPRILAEEVKAGIQGGA
jgi:outer membrane protein assembly factor BamD (BamD/ComL family)